MNDSIFKEYYTDKPFVDRFLVNSNDAIDVVIPIMHTNELWEANLKSFYREIPVHKLLVGDGGCIDNSIKVVEKYPRVQVFDHRNYKSLGYSIRKLIEAVETEWFAYLHADVFLPPGWFESMQRHQNKYDWFGCPMRHTVMVEYDLSYGERPWAGSQMGRKKAFEANLDRVDDDYVYRQEDFVFADIVKKSGFKEGKITNTFHYHQTMHIRTPWARKIKSLNMDVDISLEEEIRTCMTMAKGIVKYLDPPMLAGAVVANINRLQEIGELDWKAFYGWVKTENPAWLPALRRQRFIAFSDRCKSLFRPIYRSVFK